MSNTKIIKTACRQRDEAQKRAAFYKRERDVATGRMVEANQRASESTRYGNRMLHKFVKERRKFIAASVLAGVAIAVAVFK